MNKTKGIETKEKKKKIKRKIKTFKRNRNQQLNKN